MGPIGPKRAHFEFSHFWSFFSQVLKEKETSGKNPARQRRQECDHVNAVISGDFPKIAQNSPKRTKTGQNGQFREIPILMLEFPRPFVEWFGSGTILRS